LHFIVDALAPEVLDDFDRFFDYIAGHDPDKAPERIGEIVDAIQILSHSHRSDGPSTAACESC
jgi:toxin ParE1/3/4